MIISHTGYILDYIATKEGCVLYGGKIICHKEPKRIFSDIRGMVTENVRNARTMRYRGTNHE